jgi:colicin D
VTPTIHLWAGVYQGLINSCPPLVQGCAGANAGGASVAASINNIGNAARIPAGDPNSMIYKIAYWGAPLLLSAGEGAGETEDLANLAAEAGGGEAASLPELSASRSQLEAKFYHAPDFGVTESRGAAGFDAYGKAVNSFVGDSSTVRSLGTYRGDPAILNYNPDSGLVVVQAPSGEFISGWQMSEQQLWNVMNRGSLGGG